MTDQFSSRRIAHTGGVVADQNLFRQRNAVRLAAISRTLRIGVEHLGEEILRRNMLWFHLPIVDGSIPDQRFEQQWEVTGEEIRSLLRRGLDVLVHCRGGLGRAGTISSRLLIELGIAPKTAIKRVREVRPGAIETPAQERYVLNIDQAQK